MNPSNLLINDRLEDALRFAAVAHRDQVRRGSEVPYFQHVVAVSIILLRAAFREEVVIAGLLHDIVEDTPTTLGQIEARFGTAVSILVGYCSEVKLDAEGRVRPWIDRKSDFLKLLETAPSEAKAIVLADKLHNLISIRADLAAGKDIWGEFHASKPQVLEYYRKTLEVCGSSDAKLAVLNNECQLILATLNWQDDGLERNR